MKIASVQFNHAPGDIEYNFNKKREKYYEK